VVHADRTLQLAAPVAIAIEVATQPISLQSEVQSRLEIMKAIIDDIPDDALSDVGGDDLPESYGQRDGLARAEGQALRAMRQVLFQEDPAHAFGDMRRVQSPAGDLLWVCPVHYPEYDPGLPVLP
jgi:internalin A